jgi:hypothetical protein
MSRLILGIGDRQKATGDREKIPDCGMKNSE